MIRGIRLTLLFHAFVHPCSLLLKGSAVHSWRIEVGRMAEVSKAEALRQEIVDLTDLTASVDRLDDEYVVTTGEFSFPEEAASALPSLQKAGFKNTRVVTAILNVTVESEMVYSLEVTPVDNLLSAWQPQVEMLQRNMAPVSILSTTRGYLIRAGHFTDKNRAQEVLHQLHHEGYPYARMIEIPQSTTRTKTLN